MARRFAPHKVGMTASIAGLVALLVLDFGRVLPFRIASGDPVTLWAALGAGQVALLVGAWVALLALSLAGACSPRLALARGLFADAILIGLLWASGAAAERLLADAAPIARYSLGPGVWLSAFFAFAVVIASRREVGRSDLGVLVSALAPVGVGVAVVTGRLARLGIVMEYRNVADEFGLWVGQHVAYSAVAMVVASALGISLGVLAHRRPRLAEPVFTAASVFQTIPGLAMVGILAVPLGVLAEAVPQVRALGIGVLGWAPIVIALTLYALLAIVRNTYAGLTSVSAATVEAGRGMGMSQRQVLRKVQLPLSAPVVFSGVRTSTQQTIGNATLGVFVAAGTLGQPIFGGVSQTADDLVLLGSIALVALALVTDVAMRATQRLLSPRPLRRSAT